ncbi:hypothetical protein MTO96_014094 [Rhipicephalus appendiculatus]
MSQARFPLSDFDDSERPPWSPEFYDTDGFSPPSQPSTLRGAGKPSWRRRISNRASTPEDGSYLKTTTGSFATLTRKPRKAYWTHAGSADANRNARNRRHSFSSRALANAETRRCSMYGVSGENSEMSRDRMRTPGTTTNVKHHSHGRAQKRPHQLASTPAGRLRQSPPRKIIVFSKPRSLSPPPRIDDFSDIPPVEVILFDSPPLLLQSSRLEPPRQSAGRVTTSSPEKTKPASYIPARHMSPPSDSPTPQASVVMSVPEETGEPQASPAERLVDGWVTFEQIWLFCVVASATLLLPFTMFILSYLLTPIPDASAATGEPSITRGTASLTFTLPTWPTLATVDPWAGFPADCHQARMTSDNISRVVPQKSIRGANVSALRLFCLYNSSRFFSSSSGSFLPDNLPLFACQYIVYWSFRIADGRLMSRTPTFDLTYGLYNLTDIRKRAGAADVKVLLAVGGYAEDNTEFSLLARDADAMARFVTDAMQLVKSYNIDGLAVHWHEDETGCRHQADLGNSSTVRAIVVGLRDVFDLNGFQQGMLAIILPAGVDNATVRSLIDFVNFLFLETHKTMPQPFPIYGSICATVTHRMLGHIESQENRNSSKMCITMSVAPWMFEAQPPIVQGELPELDALSSSGEHPGFASAYEMCRSGPCLLTPSLTGSCVAVRISSPLGSTKVLVLLDETQLRNVFKLYTDPQYGPRCALLMDLELDNYAGQCNFTTSAISQLHVNLTDYWLVDRLVSVIQGARFPIGNSLPRC